MRPWDRVLDLLFPPRCPFCGQVLDSPGACGRCEARLPWTEEVRQLPDGLRCTAPLRYEGAVREALLRLKFAGASGAAMGLGTLLARCAAERFSGEFDVVAWVPVSRRRRRERGYDQSYLLARSACRCWGVEPERLLEKTADNPAQSGLAGRAARWANVREVYRPLARCRDRRVLLIDDICTTGATLCACARTLRRGGAAEVLALTAALTAENRENGKD